MLTKLPFWWAVIVLAVLFLIKHVAILRLQKTDYYMQRITGQGWMGALNTTTGLNFFATFLILFIPLLSFWWAFVFAFIDGAIHWLVGYWHKKKMLPKIDKNNVKTFSGWLFAFHTASYAGIIAFVLEFFWK